MIRLRRSRKRGGDVPRHENLRTQTDKGEWVGINRGIEKRRGAAQRQETKKRDVPRHKKFEDSSRQERSGRDVPRHRKTTKRRSKTGEKGEGCAEA